LFVDLYQCSISFLSNISFISVYQQIRPLVFTERVINLWILMSVFITDFWTLSSLK